MQFPYAEQRRTGFRALLFSGSLEEEFRQHYSQSGAGRARLMPSFALMMTLISIAMHLSGGEVRPLLMVFDLGFFLPLLCVTLYLSTVPVRYRLYQNLLALSGLMSGLVVTSLVFRPSLVGMPSYFSMEVAWIFAVWLIIGLRFRHAAIAALTISASHVYGVFYMDFGTMQVGYETVMLLLVNGIGAICCYHVEYAERRSFLDEKELKGLAKEMGALAQLDGLTGLHNRRSYDEYIERIWRQSAREQAQLTILLIDIDHFKLYNDHYGHQTGDDAIKAVANAISTSGQRPFDFAARYGGEEFVVTLYGEAGGCGQAFAEKLRKAIRALKIPHEPSDTHKYLTASIGVAVIVPGSDRSLAGAVQMADEALYQAKEKGRNCIVVMDSGKSQLNTGEFRSAGALTA